ncbi:hypothetical protein ASZ90_018516 [hydrocarbon metagenome]|uniref:Uncharacterized protein n=1 Tax=hydrocarbon metagenome TaxID=938273 RepID=A0A0W8E6P8_9ZZZZ
MINMEIIKTETSTIEDLKQVMKEQNINTNDLRITGRIG